MKHDRIEIKNYDDRYTIMRNYKIYAIEWYNMEEIEKKRRALIVSKNEEEAREILEDYSKMLAINSGLEEYNPHILKIEKIRINKSNRYMREKWFIDRQLSYIYDYDRFIEEYR